MASPPPHLSKFAVNLTFCSEDDGISTVYHKHFREVPKVKIVKQDPTDGSDTLIVPLPSSFGLVSSTKGLAYELTKYYIPSGYPSRFVDQFHHLFRKLGPETLAAIKEHITRKYLGELPLGYSFIIRCPARDSKFRFLVVVPLFRALTSKDDDIAWLDPKFVTADYAYNAMRSALLTILRHNARRPHAAIRSVYCPDFFTLRKDSPQGEELGEQELEEAVIQVLMATKSVLIEPPKESADWNKAILVTTQIIQSGQATADDLETLCQSGKLESRGLYSQEEVSQVLQWARDPVSSERREKAARVLAACLHRRDTQFTISKAEVARRISSVQEGCLPLILDMVLDGKISVHTEIPFSELTLTEKIGEGGAGSVWRGTWGTRHVAVKEFRKDIPFKEFIREISLNCVIEHPNLVKSLGGVTKNGKMMIVQELMQANLADVLAEKSIPLDSGIILEIALQAAEGIWHLHSHCNLIHRDIKSQNLLINTYNGRLEVKLGDFGVSRVINKKQVMTGNVGTVAWTAPEVFDGRRYNEKADVYSFGIILWEMCTREIPFVTLSSFAIPVLVIKGKRPDVPKYVKPKFKKLISLCWSQKPKARPEMSKMIESLKKLHSSLSPEEKSISRLDITPVFGVPGDVRHRSLEHVLTPRSESPPGSLDSSTHEEQNDSSNAMVTVTCDVPQPWTRQIADIEVAVNGVFSILQQDLDAGTILVGEKADRFLVFRANSFTLDFTEAVSNAFKFESESSRLQFSQNLLFDLGAIVGRQEALKFFESTSIDDVAVRSNAALVHLSYLGLAWVSLSSDTKFQPEEFIITENRYSCEADSWRDSARSNSKDCHCTFVAGFLHGWGRVAGGEKRACSEVQCVARGDPTCTFIHCPRPSLEANARSYAKELSLVNCTIAPFLQSRQGEPGEWLASSLPTIDKKGWDEEKSDRVLTGIEEPKWTEDDIVDHAAEAMDNFFIDPTAATVELAEAKCILMRANHLSSAVGRYFSSAMSASSVSAKFPDGKALHQHFMFEWARAIGKSNCEWFSKAIGMGENKVERLSALPTHLAYMGWSNVNFLGHISAGDLIDRSKDFSIKIQATDSFEAIKPSEEKDKMPSESSRVSSSPIVEERSKRSSSISRQQRCACIMHAGFITGWAEFSLQIKCRAVETLCFARGDPYCEFSLMPASVVQKLHGSNLSSSAPLKSSHDDSKKRRDSASKEKDPKSTGDRADSPKKAREGSRDDSKRSGGSEKAESPSPLRKSDSGPRKTPDVNPSKKDATTTTWKF